MDDEILSLQEAARYLKVSEHTIRRAIKDGMLPYAKLRGNYRIRKADLDALFHRGPPKEQKP